MSKLIVSKSAIGSPESDSEFHIRIKIPESNVKTVHEMFIDMTIPISFYDMQRLMQNMTAELVILGGGTCKGMDVKIEGIGCNRMRLYIEVPESNTDKLKRIIKAIESIEFS